MPRSKWFALLLLASLPISLLAQSDEQAPAPSSTSNAVPSDADLRAAHCVIGEERFLPGDYYYCLGGVAYGEHRYSESVRFFTTAASWASKPAQYVLAVMALNGDHQPRNRPLALAWLTLAAERSDSRFRAPHEELYKASSHAERLAADALLEKMRPIYGDATAAVRAEHRYADGMQWLARMNKGGTMYCMEGMGTLAQPNSAPSACPPLQQVSTVIDRRAPAVFEAWAGHVTVGPLQQVSPTNETN